MTVALTMDEVQELARILDARAGQRDPKIKAEVAALRKVARDPIKRQKQFKIVPGAALSAEAAKLAQFYEQAPKEQRSAFNVLLALFSA